MSGIKLYHLYQKVEFEDEFPISLAYSIAADEKSRIEAQNQLIEMNLSQIKALAEDKYSSFSKMGTYNELNDVVNSMVATYIEKLKDYDPLNKNKATTFTYLQWYLSNTAYTVLNGGLRQKSGYSSNDYRKIAKIQNLYQKISSQNLSMNTDEILLEISQKLNMSFDKVKESYTESYYAPYSLQSKSPEEDDEIFDSITMELCNEIEETDKNKIDTSITVNQLLKDAHLSKIELDIINHYFYQERSYQELLSKYDNTYSADELNYIYASLIEKLKKMISYT